MDHTFLLRPGRWNLKGHLFAPNQPIVPLAGSGRVSWDSGDWYQLALQIQLHQDPAVPEWGLQYRGRMDPGQANYTFVMQHSEMGRVEGEGWITPATLIQRYWVLGNDPQKRSGVEVFFQQPDGSYTYTNTVIAGLRILSSIEAVLISA